jgi:hypothetical protein
MEMSVYLTVSLHLSRAMFRPTAIQRSLISSAAGLRSSLTSCLPTSGSPFIVRLGVPLNSNQNGTIAVSEQLVPVRSMHPIFYQSHITIPRSEAVFAC